MSYGGEKFLDAYLGIGETSLLSDDSPVQLSIRDVRPDHLLTGVDLGDQYISPFLNKCERIVDADSIPGLQPEPPGNSRSWGEANEIDGGTRCSSLRHDCWFSVQDRERRRS